MGQGKVPSYTILAIKRILEEYTGGSAYVDALGRMHQGQLSVSEIRELLADIYDIHVGDDYLRRTALPALEEFCSKTRAHDKLAEHETPNLFPDERIRIEGPTNAKKHVGLVSRPFLDFEVDFISDAIESSVFMNMESSSDLVRRIRGLHSPAGRERDFSAVGNLDDDYRHTRETSTIGASHKSVKPSIGEFEYNLELIKDALYDRDATERATISFDVSRYSVCRGNTCEVERRGDLDHYESLTVYELIYMNGHYFILTNKPHSRRARDEFSTFRVDLMENVEIDDPQTSAERYRTLRDEDAPKRYMRGAIDGYCGKVETVTFRCNAYAMRYVIERYSDFPNFKVVRKLTPDPADHSKAEEKKAWYEVRFDCVPKGFEQWSMKFLEDIEILSPAKSRAHVIEQIRHNAYGLEVAEPGGQEG